MSGFAVIIKAKSSVQAEDSGFQSFIQLVASYKGLDLPTELALGQHCLGAKLDSPATRRRGIVRDETTGSWLLAVGTVFDTRFDDGAETDLLALLQDYLERGQDALQHYDGHFGLVICNQAEESLSVISVWMYPGATALTLTFRVLDLQ